MKTLLGSLLAGLALLTAVPALSHSGDATGFASIGIDGSKVIYRYTPTTSGATRTPFLAPAVVDLAGEGALAGVGDGGRLDHRGVETDPAVEQEVAVADAAQPDAAKVVALQARGVTVVVLPDAKGKVDLVAMLQSDVRREPHIQPIAACRDQPRRR